MRETKQIGDWTFHVQRMGPFKALKVLGDLQKHILGPASAALDGQRPGALADAIAAVSDKLDGATLERLAKLLLDQEFVSVSGGSDEMRKLSEGQANLTLASAGDLLDLCIFVAQVNYADFLAKFMAQAQQAMPSLSGTATASAMN